MSNVIDAVRPVSVYPGRKFYPVGGLVSGFVIYAGADDLFLTHEEARALVELLNEGLERESQVAEPMRSTLDDVRKWWDESR